MTLKITEEFVRSRFMALNKMMFENSLPMPKIRIGKYTRVAGLFLGKGRTGTLTVSQCFDYDAATLDEVIIHEMIHCCLWQRGDRGALRHGRAFHRECRRIHDEYGMTIHDIAPRMELLDRYRRKVPLYERIAYYVLWPFNCVLKPFRYLYDLWF